MLSEHIGGENIPALSIPVLSEKENMVLKVLAERGPLSGYDFHLGGRRIRGNRKALMSSGFWLKVLERLGPDGFNLICQVELRGRPRQGESKRRKKLFWLTGLGLIYVLAEAADVNPKKVLENAQRVYGKQSLETLLVRLRILVGSEIFKLCSVMLFNHGLSEENIANAALMSILYVKKFSHIDAQTLNQKLNRLLEDYPEIRELKKRWIAEAKQSVLSLED